MLQRAINTTFKPVGRRFMSSQVPPFHLAVPVHDLAEGFIEGRSSKQWQDYNMFGHQLVVHQVTKDYRGVDFFNPVDADDVPVPHFGVALTVDEFHALSKRVQGLSIKFIVEPHLRFAGRKGEQWTMFFKDPSGNNLEFKAMTNPENLFAKYVEE
ncbi:putative VOC domain-containing protein [Phytophthora infestans]|uniref:Putative VOC domain-containing protein n=1 Tax=Phytophthora infestans TaxID=4787 RepID=A0A833WIP6_PHYIN|nr:putative VOC domain-containing protein [Phytophthora infestans]